MYMSLLFFIIIHHIDKANAIGLIFDLICVPFKSVSPHSDTSDQSYSIGWLKVISCIEGTADGDEFTYHFHHELIQSKFNQQEETIIQIMITLQ